MKKIAADLLSSEAARRDARMRLEGALKMSLIRKAQAIDRLLAGSGLIEVQEGNGLVIEAAASTGDVSTLAAMRVTGSVDSTTEGSGSYILSGPIGTGTP